MTWRLILLGGIAIAFLSLGGLMLKYRGDAIAAEAETARIKVELQQAVDANAEQAKAIEALQALAKLANDLNESLQAEIQTLTDEARLKNAELNTLRNSNASVRDFLDTPAPDDLRKLYDR